MFITENQNIGESILFLGCARFTLNSIVEGSSIKNKVEMSNFIMNEATDYEIMHLLVREELPNERYNQLDEIAIFATLKEHVINNMDTLSKTVDIKDIKSFVTEVDSVYPTYSSAVPVLEHSLNQIRLDEASYLAEDGHITKTISQFLKLKTAYDRIPKTPAEIKAAVKGAVNAEVEKAKLLNQAEEKAKEMKAMYDGTVKAVMDKWGVNRGVAEKLLKMKDWKGQMNADIAKWAGIAGGKAKEYGDKIAQGAEDAKEKLKGVGDVANKAGGAAIRNAKGAYNSIKGGTATADIQAKASSATSAVKAYLQANPEVSGGAAVVSAAALSALAIYGSFKTFKRFFSQSAKACSKLSGSKKTECMKKFKIDAIMKQIQDLNKSAAGCNKTKNPQKCKQPIMNKIQKLKIKIQKTK